MAVAKALLWVPGIFALLSAAAPAQTPLRTIIVEPKSLYVNYGSVVDITVYGPNVSAAGESSYAFPNDVKLLARRNGKPFADASKDLKGWTSGRLDIEFDSRDFDLQTPGSLDFVAVVKGVKSGIISIPVKPYPNVPPTIVSIGPNSFAENLPLQHQYLVHIDAKNTPDDTKVTINGEPLTFFADADFSEGSIDVYVPEDLRSRAGSYPVVISSRSGDSKPVMVHIRDFRAIANAATPKPKPTVSAAAVVRAVATLRPTPIPRATVAVAALDTPLVRATPVVRVTPSPRPSPPAYATLAATPVPSIAAYSPLPTATPTKPKNPFLGTTPIPASPQRATAATASPEPAEKPVVAAVARAPFHLSPIVMPRYRSLAAVLLPTLRSTLDSIVSNEVQSMNAGATDPEAIAMYSLETVRPSATPAQMSILESYILANALDALTASTASAVPRSAVLDANERKANAALLRLMRKNTEEEDVIVQYMK